MTRSLLPLVPLVESNYNDCVIAACGVDHECTFPQYMNYTGVEVCDGRISPLISPDDDDDDDDVRF